ncbi:MAG: hypothetical protein JXB88_07355 [Spirochaetales bacterium]|nr:hypothetical protein [Spirochaetales bacterium]
MDKNLILLLLVFCLCAGNLAAQVTGDVNVDNDINIIDALMTAQFYVGLGPSPFDQSVADVDADNDVDIIDALMIAQFYVGLISSFPASKVIPPLDYKVVRVPVIDLSVFEN